MRRYGPLGKHALLCEKGLACMLVCTLCARKTIALATHVCHRLHALLNAPAYIVRSVLQRICMRAGMFDALSRLAPVTHAML